MNPDKTLIRRNYNIICALIRNYEKVLETMTNMDNYAEEVNLIQLTILPVKQVFIENIATYFEEILCELTEIHYPDSLLGFDIGFTISVKFGGDNLRNRLYQQKLTSFKEDLDKMLKDYL